MKHQSGWFYHGGAIVYAIAATGFGIAGILQESWTVRIGATLLLAHGMVIAAYLVHEAGHNTIFRMQRHNLVLGRILCWFCGAAYNRFEDIRYKHFRHHVENDDIMWFDYERFFREHPFVFRVTRALEWAYIPAHDVIMHGAMMINAFIIPERHALRTYNVAVIFTRLALFVLLAWVSPVAALLYCVAMLLMIVVLRFMDSLQHDYPYRLTLFSSEQSPHRGDLQWEQEHTFSVPLSLRYPVVNWLTLNFGYHNAHHARPDEPWYRLPRIHREMFGDDPAAVIPLRQQLRIYHRGRTHRMLKWDDDAVDAPSPEGRAFLLAAQRGEVQGGNAASFLTAL